MVVSKRIYQIFFRFGKSTGRTIRTQPTVDLVNQKKIYQIRVKTAFLLNIPYCICTKNTNAVLFYFYKKKKTYLCMTQHI
jgi:hypothetical protein